MVESATDIMSFRFSTMTSGFFFFLLKTTRQDTGFQPLWRKLNTFKNHIFLRTLPLISVLISPLFHLDFVVPPLVYSNEPTLLRDSTESTTLPSTMQDFFSLLHSEGLLKTLEGCSHDCLYYSVSDSPYQLMNLSLDLGMEFVVYLLVWQT